MSTNTIPPAALDLFTPEERRQIALREIDAVVQNNVNQSVGAVRSQVAAELTEIDPTTVGEYTQALDKAAGSHQAVKVENLGPGTMGINYQVGTHNTAVDASMLSSEIVLNDSKQLTEVLEHENSAAYGHAGQKFVDSLVDSDGDTIETITILEGEVETNMTARHGQRENQPAMYKEGEEFVQSVGATTISDYTRDGASRIDTQVQIFENSDLDETEQIEAMEKAGFSTPEMRAVYLETRKDFEMGPELKEELAMAA